MADGGTGAAPQRDERTEPSTLAGRRVLLVETEAHTALGHFSSAFVPYAAGFEELGVPIEILTSDGWIGPPDRFHLHRLGRFGRWAYRRSVLARKVRPRATGRGLALALQTLVVAVAARRLARRRGCTDIILFTFLDAGIAGLVGGRGRWGAVQMSPPANPVGRATLRLAGRLRRRHRLRLLTISTENLEGWQEAAAWARPMFVPMAVVQRTEPEIDARAGLGLPDDARVALCFGSHPGKDLEVVFEAFSRLPDWHLVVAGRSDTRSAADRYRAWAAGRSLPATAPVPTLVEGFADRGTRAALFSATDVVVASFHPWVQVDSATLADTLSYGRVVVCSDGCPSARLVRTFRLGTVFAPGDADALVAAVRAAPARPDPDGLHEVLDEISGPAVARRVLAALADLEPEAPDPARSGSG